jgi:tRNA nucleotidyltransferase (CCA-adding enzyme)
MTSVRDIMVKSVTTLTPEMTMGEALHRLLECDCSGAPVVAADGALVGMISELAMLDLLFDFSTRNSPISKHMNTHVRTAHPDESLTTVAHMFELYSIRRIPVVENDRLVGIITRRDLLNYAIDAIEPLAGPLEELFPELEQTV